MVDGLIATLLGAIVGFYYAGILTGKEPRWAIVGAVLGGVGLGAISLKWRIPFLPLVLRLASAIAAYGFAFLIGITAFACLNVGFILWGAVLGALSLLYLGFTWKTLRQVVQILTLVPARNRTKNSNFQDEV
jgi:hypothetical protein